MIAVGRGIFLKHQEILQQFASRFDSSGFSSQSNNVPSLAHRITYYKKQDQKGKKLWELTSIEKHSMTDNCEKKKVNEF